MADFAEHVREMNERVIELSRSYAIFWVFIDTGNCKQYSQVIQDHKDFFDATASSLHLNFCVITYQLFQKFDPKHDDVKSLPSLINYLSSLNPALAQQLNSNIEAQRNLLTRYFTYRNKIYGHRDKAKSPWELFGKVPKPRVKREMKAIIELSRNIVCALAGVSGVRKKSEMAQEIRRRENYARWDANEILKSLKGHKP